MHLDGRQLLVSSNEGDIVKPGSFKVVYDEGMPQLRSSTDKGRLFVHFDVKFPEPGDLADKDVVARAPASLFALFQHPKNRARASLFLWDGQWDLTT